MKKFLTLALAVLALASCQKDDKSAKLTVTPASLTFAAGETAGKVVAVTTDAREWNATTDYAWIELSQDGSALTVSMNETHMGTASREGSVSVSASGADPVTITVTQEARQSLSVSPVSLNFDAGQTGSKTVTVTTDATEGWKANYPTGWFTVSSSADGKLVVTVNTLHYGASAREAAITVTAGNAASATINVSQTPTQNTLSFSPSSLDFGAFEKGSKNVSITTDAAEWTATETVSWLTISTGTGSTLVVTVTETNPGESSRSGTISVVAGNQTKNLTVTQAGSALSFSDIKYGSYTANGTPSAPINNPGPRTWTGTIRPNTTGQYYELTNFGGDGITVRLKFKQGKIYIDGTYMAAEDSEYEGYLRACYRNGSSWAVMNSGYEHPVAYNIATRTLTFATNIPSEPSSPTALIGVLGLPKSSNTLGWFTDVYTNLTIRLTDSTRAAADEATSEPAARHKIKESSEEVTFKIAQ